MGAFLSIDPTALANLLTLSVSGQNVASCAYWKITWDAGHISYYSDSAYHQIPPFTGIGHTIEPRIMMGAGNTIAKDSTFELNPDLKTETISVKFEDIDKDITAKFQTYGSGVRAELFFYYPDVGVTYSPWYGQLTAPKIYGWKNLDCVITNGFRDREQQIPKRTRPRECTSDFGGQLTAQAAETTICIYQAQNGGPGNLNPLTGLPYLACDKSIEACIKRLGVDYRGKVKYHGGFDADANAVAFPAHHNPGYIAVSQGNASALTESIRVVAGVKKVRALQLIKFLLGTPPGVEHGWIFGIWEICEGPIASVSNVRINDYSPSWTYRNGTRGQSTSGFGNNLASNYSGTAHIYSDYGYIDTTNFTEQTVNAECDVVGFSDVAQFDAMGDYTRVQTDNRVWWVMALYENQRWGMAYPFSRFNIPDWKEAADWSYESVNFHIDYPDGEHQDFPHYRTTFNAILEGRSAQDQVEDICRSGGLCIPFQHEGAFTIRGFKIAEDTDLEDARIFTDGTAGTAPRNICWDSGNPEPLLTLEQTPNDKIVNEIELTFEDVAQGDAARPIKVDDPDQKALAGRELGDNNLKTVKKSYSAFGVRTLQEAVTLAYRFLRFGEFDSGGTENNLKATLVVPFEQVLGIKKFDIIKIESALLDGFLSPENEPFDYFRITKMNKLAGSRCQIIAQAYNHTAYTDFEAPAALHDCPEGYHYDYTLSMCVRDSGDGDPNGCPIGFHFDEDIHRCVRDLPEPERPAQVLTIDTIDYDPNNLNIEVTIS